MTTPAPNRKPLPMAAFAAAALAPVPLLALGVFWGGAWAWAGFLAMACLAALLDQLIPLVAGDAAEGQEFPGADALLVGIALAAFALIPLAVWAVAGPSGLSAGERALVAFGTGLWLGQVAHPAGHELIHSPARPLFRLGQAIYTLLLFGQHASAHRLVHHRYVASPKDTNSPRGTESFYRFAPRAWAGSFREGWAEEDALRARAKGPRGPHPYAIYIGGGLAALGAGFAVAGPWGVLAWIGLALHAQAQILVSDYVQHYGLTRATLPDGRLEPVGPQHSWNAPHWASSALMLNATRHSDHHAHPARPYPALRLPGAEEAPHLPWPLPVACTLAFLPRLWRRAMRPHLARWRPAPAAAAAAPAAATPADHAKVTRA